MRALLVINATLNENQQHEIDAGRYPRKDYLELQRTVCADVLDLTAVDRPVWCRIARRVAGAAAVQALLAWTRARHYDAIFADREASGFVLAALFRLPGRRPRPRLVMIGHRLSPARKQILFRALRLRRSIDCVVVHSTLQQRVAERMLGLRRDQVALVPYQTDERFWSPQDAVVKKQICSVGLEFRDYGTFVEAINSLDVEAIIVAASYWSKHQSMSEQQALPSNVRLASSSAASFDYEDLRQLYAESLFVVVPLHDVESPAGITTILEAMAMGKAVIVSHSRGQTDVVRDRRRLNRTDPRRRAQPDWARILGATDDIVEGRTGMYVMPGNPMELRRAIEYLLEHPEEARLMGANGRRLVEEVMGLDQFTTRVAKLIVGAELPPVASARTSGAKATTLSEAEGG